MVVQNCSPKRLYTMLLSAKGVLRTWQISDHGSKSPWIRQCHNIVAAFSLGVEGRKPLTVGVFWSIFDNSRTGRNRAQGPTPSAPKQWKSDVHVKSYNPVSARSATDEIQERKNYKEGINIKSACVSALTGWVPRKMAEGLQRVSAPCGNRTQVALLPATHLYHSAIGSCQSDEKNGIWLVI